MTHTLERSGTLTAYEALAPFYDAFTAGHDYDLWTTVIRRLARRHGLAGTRLLDIGCGTGKSFLPFVVDGWQVTACDISSEMLELAAAKAPPEVELHLADARALPRLGRFDLVLLLDDVVNYFTDEEELVSALTAAAANMADDGVLVFDVNLLRAYRTFFAETVIFEDGDTYLAWRGRTPSDAGPGVLAEGVLDAFTRDADGSWQRHDGGHHRQRHHTEVEVRSALAAAGLDCVGVYGHGLDGKPVAGADELRHTKALFIARCGAHGDGRR
jgi:predicted TPR repeat methyltransferase